MINLTPIRLTVRTLGVVAAVACLMPFGTGCRRLSSIRMPKRKPAPVLLGPREIVPPPFRAPSAFVAIPDAPEPLVMSSVVAPAAIEMPEPVGELVKPVEPKVVLPPPVKSKPLSYTMKKGDTLWDIALMYGVAHQELAVQNSIGPGDEKKLKPGTVLQIPPGGRFIPPEKRPKIKKQSPPAKKISKAGKKTGSGGGSKRVARQAFPADGKYIVKSGDSLWLIARRFGLKSAAIREINSLKTDVLQPGQVLFLPKPQSGAATKPKKVTSGGTGASAKTTVTPGKTSGSQAKAPDKEPIGKTIEVPPTVPAPAISFPKTLEHTVSKDETLEIIADMYDTKVQEVKAANPTIKSNADLRENMKILVPYH